MQVQGEAIIRNNLLIAGKNSAFASTDHQGKTTNIQFVHNTLVNTSHAFRGGSWNARDKMVIANNILYSREQNAFHFANGYEAVVISGNVVLGNGPKQGSRIGRGLEDFKKLSWDGSDRDATPALDSQFTNGALEFHLTIDLFGKARDQKAVISGAVIP